MREYAGSNPAALTIHALDHAPRALPQMQPLAESGANITGLEILADFMRWPLMEV